MNNIEKLLVVLLVMLTMLACDNNHTLTEPTLDKYSSYQIGISFDLEYNMESHLIVGYKIIGDDGIVRQCYFVDGEYDVHKDGQGNIDSGAMEAPYWECTIIDTLL